MATTYERAPKEILEIIASLVEEYHPTTKEAGVTFDVLLATSDSGPAVKLNGWPCNATVKIVGGIERMKGAADIEIKIDAEKYEELTDDERRALLDHELYHVQPIPDDALGGYKKDAYGRPRIKMRPHDVQVGWFKEIAERHGSASMERKQARQLFDDYGQGFWPFLSEAQPELKIVEKPPGKKAA